MFGRELKMCSVENFTMENFTVDNFTFENCRCVR